MTEAKRISAVGDISTLPSNLKESFTNHGEFKIKRNPIKGEWLDEHEEAGQTFAQYLRYRANFPNQRQNVIYLLPLGNLESEHNPSLSTVAKGLEAYFYPMKAKLLPPVKNTEIPVKTRVHQGRVQLHCEETLNWMRHQLPNDAYAMLAITMTDLYPKEGWNYVFGLASLKRRVGVFSLARLQPKISDAHAKTRLLERTLKLITHETGHMFGMKHCTHYECNMGGVNHLTEADKAPLNLCPVCLRKLHHSLHFNPSTRYIKLLTYYRKHQLHKQAKWAERRLDLIHTSP